MRILIDTNIVLDFLLQREPFFQETERLFQAIEVGRVIGYVTATTLTDIFYIARRHTSSIEQAQQALLETLVAMEICSVDRAVLESALGLGFVDFEDAVQVACALAEGLDAIITRDANFEGTSIPVLSTNEVLQQLASSD